MSEPTQEKPAYAPGWNPGPLNRILLYGLSLRETVLRRRNGEHVPRIPEKPEQKEAA